MKEIRGEILEEKLILHFSGHVDSNNAPAVEEEINKLLADAQGKEVSIDAKDLEYISSAGLRVLLHIRKSNPNLHISNVSSEIYEILDMTGFTQMMQVEKAYRVVSIEGCEEIGRGANGTIYRIDKDNVVKVYNNADALADIQHEREVARKALVLGIPTAISYDVVRVGESYGSVFELLNARSFSKIIATEPDKLDWCVKEYVDMLRKIHGTLVPKGDLPDIKETAVGWAKFVQDYLPEQYGKKLLNLITAIPHDDHMIHGDYHTKNLELTGDEVLLIDMDTLSVGHPIFELASMYNAFIGFSEVDHEIVKDFLGFDFETSHKFWRKSLATYLGTADEEKITAVEDKARIVGYTRLIRRSIRRGGLENEAEKKTIDHWTKELIELLDKVDSLLFTSNELLVEADNKNLAAVLAFVDSHLESADCPMKIQMQIDVAVEEIFSNIANYAYAPGTGDATIKVNVTGEPPVAEIKFIDSGMEYNPLEKEDPDITLAAEDRPIGGLGVFMVKKSMDEVQYNYENGQNIFTIRKQLI